MRVAFGRAHGHPLGAGDLLEAEVERVLEHDHLRLCRRDLGQAHAELGAELRRLGSAGGVTVARLASVLVQRLATPGQLPLRNVPVIAPLLSLDAETIDPVAVADATRAMLKRLDLNGGEQPVAVFVPWQGSATFQRLDAFCRGVVDGLENILKKGHPLVLAGDGDIGGLLGIHLHEEMRLRNAVVSIDGLELKEFDYIDIGAMLETTGAVPVVIKSLIFPGSAKSAAT